ncbi:MAG: hypothetical protein J6H31_07395 [Butyrivibrio sp.]|nr:hypothetical protein [Butyrivibrio sp.]
MLNQKNNEKKTIECNYNDNYSDRRNTYIDFVKYFTIFCVLWGHVIQQTCMLQNPNIDYIYRFIYTFHMPTFMSICGYYFAKSLNKYGLKKYVKIKLLYRLKSLIIPMLSFGAIKMVIFNKYDIIFYLQMVHDIWFLGSLVINTIVVLAVFHWCNGDFGHDIKFFIMVAPFASIPKIEYGGQGLFMYLFFIIGFIFYNYFQSKLLYLLKMRWLIFLSIFIITFIVFDNLPFEPSGIIFFKDELLRSLIVFALKIILGITGTYLIFLSLYKIFPYLKNNFIVKLSVKRGRYTLDIYLLQIIILEIIGGRIYREILRLYEYNIIYQYGIIGEIIMTIVITSIFMEIVVFCGKVINRQRYMAKVFFYR